MVSPVYNKLNKIDSILKSKFENVEFIDSFNLPKSSKGHEQYMFVVESNENPNYKIKIVIDGVDALMMERNLTWSYFVDTSNEESNKIKRNSIIDNLSQDVLNVFERKMFESSYLDSLNNLELLNENKEELVDNEYPNKLFFLSGVDPNAEGSGIVNFNVKLLREEFPFVEDYTEEKRGDNITLRFSLSSNSMDGEITSAQFLKLDSYVASCIDEFAKNEDPENDVVDYIDHVVSTHDYMLTIEISGGIDGWNVIE